MLRSSWLRPLLWIPSLWLGAAAKPTFADLYFLNESQDNVSVAIAWCSGPQRFTAKGWFNAAPGERVTVQRGDMTGRIFNFYAECPDRGIKWDGSIQFLIHPTVKFSIDQDMQCNPIRVFLPNGDGGRNLAIVGMRSFRIETFDNTQRLIEPNTFPAKSREAPVGERRPVLLSR